MNYDSLTFDYISSSMIGISLYTTITSYKKEEEGTSGVMYTVKSDALWCT